MWLGLTPDQITALAQGVALLTLHYAATTDGRYRGHRLALFGWAVFGEKLVPLQFAGGCLILFGVWIARPRQSKPAN